jgi:hypothetical protein
MCGGFSKRSGRKNADYRTFFPLRARVNNAFPRR